MQYQVLKILLFLLINNVCLAQSNFIKAKIISNQSDTLAGYIDYKEWIKSPTEISFRKELSSSTISYSVNDLRGFMIDSKQETHEMLNFKLEKLTRTGRKPIFESLGKYVNRNKEMIEKQAFVRVLARGKVNLYQFVDKDLESHFLVKQNDKLEPLIYHIIEVKNELIYLKQYQAQLTNLLTDACKKLSVESSAYLPNELKKIIDNYNECFEKTSLPQLKQKTKGKWEYGVELGAEYTTFTYTFPTIYANFTVKGDANFVPVGGLFFNYVFARARGKFALLNEINTYSLKSNTSSEKENNQYNIQYIALQNLFRYKIYSRKTDIYFIAGLSNALTISNKSSPLKNVTGFQLKINKGFFRPDEQALIGGFGFGFNKLMLESRYIIGNGFAASLASKTATRRIEFIAKFNFGR